MERLLTFVNNCQSMFALRQQHYATTYISWKSLEKKTLIATEQKREDVVEQRKKWQQFQSIADETKLVFIDAVLLVVTPSLQRWATTNMTPLYGRADKDKRVIDDVPHCPCYVILFGNNFDSSIALWWYDITNGRRWCD